MHEPALHDGDELPIDAWSLEMSLSRDDQTECATWADATPTHRQSQDATSPQPTSAVPALHDAGSWYSDIPLPNPFGFPPYVARQRSPPPPPQQSSPDRLSPTSHGYESDCDRYDRWWQSTYVPATILDAAAGPYLRRRARVNEMYSREARQQHRIIRQR